MSESFVFAPDISNPGNVTRKLPEVWIDDRSWIRYSNFKEKRIHELNKLDWYKVKEIKPDFDDKISKLIPKELQFDELNNEFLLEYEIVDHDLEYLKKIDIEKQYNKFRTDIDTIFPTEDDIAFKQFVIEILAAIIEYLPKEAQNSTLLSDFYVKAKELDSKRKDLDNKIKTIKT